MKIKKLLAAIAVGFGLITSAHAGLVGVKTIEVKNAIGTWLQVAEVVALDMGATDVALSSNGATASAPDWWSSISQPGKAIDGITAGNYSLGQIFHEGSPFTNDTLTITLAAIAELDSIQIFGRTDACCSSRDVYAVTFRNESGVELYRTRLDARGADHNGLEVLPDTSVPEPASLALVGLSLLGLATSRRIRRA